MNIGLLCVPQRQLACPLGLSAKCIVTRLRSSARRHPRTRRTVSGLLAAVASKESTGGTPPLHLGDVPELGSFSTHRPADRPHRRGLPTILLALYVIHAPQPAPHSRASVALVYPPAARASVSTTAMFGNSAWGTPCRSFRYAGLL